MGIVVTMFYLDNKQHATPHLHANFQNQSVVLSVSDGELLAGDFPAGKLKILRAWIEIHKDDLLADWELAVSGRPVFAIEPLR